VTSLTSTIVGFGDVNQKSVISTLWVCEDHPKATGEVRRTAFAKAKTTTTHQDAHTITEVVYRLLDGVDKLHHRKAILPTPARRPRVVFVLLCCAILTQRPVFVVVGGRCSFSSGASRRCCSFASISRRCSCRRGCISSA
jgi:hypothetical protein